METKKGDGMGYVVFGAVIFVMLVTLVYLYDTKDQQDNSKKVELLKNLQLETETLNKKMEGLKSENEYLHGAIDGLIKRVGTTEEAVKTVDTVANSALKASGKTQHVKVEVEIKPIQVEPVKIKVYQMKRTKPLLPKSEKIINPNNPPKYGTHDTIGSGEFIPVKSGKMLLKKSLLKSAGITT